MPRAKLKRLSIQNFRSFADLTQISLPTSGNVLLNGKNLDTGGSSGSGKSNIAAAIAVGLGFAPYAANDLQSWFAKKPWSVALDIETERGLVTISRGKKTSLSVDGKPFEGSSKQIDEKLIELIGLGPEMLELLTYRGQKKTGFFLSMTDLAKKEFLTRLLGLDSFESALAESAETLRALDTLAGVQRAQVDTASRQVAAYEPLPSVENAESVLAAAQSELEETKAAKKAIDDELTMLERQVTLDEKAAVGAFDKKIAEAREEFAGLTIGAVSTDETESENLKLMYAEVEDRLNRLRLADSVARTEVQKKTADFNRRLRSMEMKLGARAGVLSEKQQLEEQMSSLANDICPTCERQWAEANEKLADLTQHLAEVEKKLAEFRATEEEMASVTAELEAVPEFQPNPLIAKFENTLSQVQAKRAAEEAKAASAAALARSEFQARRAEAKAKIDALLLAAKEAGDKARKSTAASIADLRQQSSAFNLQELYEVVSYAKTELSSARQAVAAYESAKKTLKQLQDKLSETEVKLAAEKDFQLLVGREGFLGSVFDEALQAISDETNRILASVANTRHCTLRFVSESLTQKGTTQRKITPVITIGEFEASFQSGLSGGMQSVVELATDLAVGAVIGQRSGACPAWLILDECFEGLGPVEKESCVEILQTYAHDRLVLVIDHGSEFKASFTKTIDIEFEGGKSSVKGQ